MRFRSFNPGTVSIALLLVPVGPVVPVTGPQHALMASPVSSPHAPVEGVKYDIDSAHSSFEFVVRFMGLSKVRGRFAAPRGTIVYDAARPERSTVTVIIPVSSIDTDNDFRDRHLRSPDWFGAEKHPTITFQSRRIERAGEDEFVVHGPLTIRGTTREVAIPMTRLHEEKLDAWGNRRIGFEGELEIDRKAYGVEGTNFFNAAFDVARMGVSDEVRIELTISASIQNMERVGFWGEEGKRLLGERIMQVIEADGIDAAVSELERIRAEEADLYDMGENQLNTVGYKLLQAGRVSEAVRVFEVNRDLHPESANVHDSLGEAYATAGDETRAIASYERALERDPMSTSAIEMLRWLRDSDADTAARRPTG